MSKKNRQNSDFHINENHLIELLKLHNSNRVDYNERKWAGVKFFQTLVNALFLAVIGGLLIIIKEGLEINIWLKTALCLILFIASIAAYLAIRNLRRESKLLFFEELQIFKISKILGFDQQVPNNKRFLIDDESFLLEKWRVPNYLSNCNNINNVEEWVDMRIRKHYFYKIMRCLFCIQIIVGFALGIIIFCLIA